MVELTAQLSRAGCVAAEEEARELVACAGADRSLLSTLTDRRLAGEPLAWITGRAAFGDLDVVVHPGVYVPRWQSVELARRAAARLPDDGVGVDLCTGAGAVAVALRAARPAARVLATDCDARAVECAVGQWGRGGAGRSLRCRAALVAGDDGRGRGGGALRALPALHLLPRDTLEFEDTSHYDGGPDGTDVLRRVVQGAPDFLRRGGGLLLELGGDQDELLRPTLERLGYDAIGTWCDEDGDLRGLEATMA